jgi:hypothetical protein
MRSDGRVNPTTGIGLSEVCKLDNELQREVFGADDSAHEQQQLASWIAGRKSQWFDRCCAVLEKRCGAVNMTPAKQGV